MKIPWDTILKWLAGGAGAVILLGFANWIIAQEVSEQMEPVQQEYKIFSQTVEQMQFDDRFTEVQAEHNICIKEWPVEYCDAVAQWRWDVWYPYLECIGPIEKFEDRKPMCGPVPSPPGPPGGVEP